jgi:hypothetical protein
MVHTAIEPYIGGNDDNTDRVGRCRAGWAGNGGKSERRHDSDRLYRFASHFSAQGKPRASTVIAHIQAHTKSAVRIPNLGQTSIQHGRVVHVRSECLNSDPSPLCRWQAIVGSLPCHAIVRASIDAAVSSQRVQWRNRGIRHQHSLDRDLGQSGTYPYIRSRFARGQRCEQNGQGETAQGYYNLCGSSVPQRTQAATRARFIASEGLGAHDPIQSRC